MTKASTSIFILFAIFSMLSSCEKEPPRLTRSHKKIVDSLVQDRKVGLRAELDSLCDIKYDAQIQSKIDSIVKDRMAEIKRKIEADAKKY